MLTMKSEFFTYDYLMFIMNYAARLLINHVKVTLVFDHVLQCFLDYLCAKANAKAQANSLM